MGRKLATASLMLALVLTVAAFVGCGNSDTGLVPTSPDAGRAGVFTINGVVPTPIPGGIVQVGGGGTSTGGSPTCTATANGRFTQGCTGAGATFLCKDGVTSCAAESGGACSSHGGVCRSL